MRFEIENLKEIQEIQNWNGKGTKDDPILLDFEKVSIDSHFFKSIKSHIIIKNLKADTLTLKNCQNFTIKDSDIQHLYLEFCYNIIVEANKIKEMKSAFSKSCIIRNNKFHAYNMNFKSNNAWAELFIYDEYFLNFFALSLMSLVVGFGLIILGLIHINLHLSGEGFIYIGITFLIISGFSVLPAIHTKHRISKIKNLPNIVYENNRPYN